MNRRNFLKSLTAVCGAAVVCPVELLKGKTEREILLEKFRAAFKATKFKPPVPKGTKAIIGERSKHAFVAGRWVDFYTAYQGQYYD